MAYKRLGDILLSAGAITQEQLNQALEIGHKQNERLGTVLISNGLITERQLIDVLKLQLGVEFVDLTKVTIPAAMAGLVPKNLAKKHSVVPVRAQGDALYLAMEDPLNFVAIEEIRAATKKRIIPMIATASATERAIVTLYGNEGMTRAIGELEKSIAAGGIYDMEAVSASSSADDDNAEAAPAIRLVNSILERAAAENASDIHLEPRAEGLVIRMRIDGVLYTMLTIPKSLQNAITSRIKIMAEMDIAERRLPQDGRAYVTVRQKDIDLRISTLPTLYGEKIVIRLLVKSEQLLSSAGIGLEGSNLAKYKELISNSNGVVLIVGPTGSGKSSTMYTMVSELYSEELNIVTLEDPIEYNLDGINQVQTNEKIGMTFAAGLRSILRQDPDIIAVGEIRDGETAEIAMRAAITGHLVLSTVHTNDAVSALDRLSDIGIEPYIIASAVKGVISQRLVRRICPHCRQSYVPTDEELLEVGLEPGMGIRFFRGVGCSECLNAGYRGRTAVFEILTLDANIKRKIRTGAPADELQAAVQESGFEPMINDCQRLVMSGVTTAAEIRRILHSTDV